MKSPRAEFYRAAQSLPHVRQDERRRALALLDIQPEHVVCDVPAWYGYLTEETESRERVVCIDQHADVLTLIEPGPRVLISKLEALPLEDASVDRLGSLVGMHHLEDPNAFLRETWRVLRPGGRIVVSEVLLDTPVAAFLDDSVHRLTSSGHRAKFFAPGECAERLIRAGFGDVKETREDVAWMFRSVSEMGSYCRNLLAMTRATEARVVNEIYRHFRVQTNDDGSIVLPWSLTYATGVKA